MVNRWEADVHRPSLESLKRIAKASGRPLIELVEEVAQ